VAAAEHDLEGASLAALRDLVRLALREDVGPGDLTAAAVVPRALQARATVSAKSAGRFSGLPAAQAVFAELDPHLTLVAARDEGEAFSAGDLILTLYGSATAILAGERTALNFLQHLSGVATQTARYVAAVSGKPLAILDTRKTTPGLRALEKRAVRHGGGQNHRQGLFDALLVKENHVAAAGGFDAAVSAAVAHAARRIPPAPVIVEVRTADELALAVRPGVTRILLDNFSPGEVGRAVARIDALAGAGSRPGIEVSGGIALETIAAYALPGVDCISIGALTHSVPACDFSLILEPEERSI